MRQLRAGIMLSLTLTTSSALGAAESPALGLVMTRSSFRLDGVEVWDSATVLDSTTIETARTSLELGLNNGARLTLAAESRAKVGRQGLDLERGTGELRNTTEYWIGAAHLRVFAAVRGAVARVNRESGDQILVAALNGPVRVTTSRNRLVADIAPGTTLVFDAAQPIRPEQVKVCGGLIARQGRYLLTDATTNVTVEVVGAGLEQHVGATIEVVGVTDPNASPLPSARWLVRVAEFKRCSCSTPGGGTASGRRSGLSAGSKTAIITGIGVGAGLAIASLEGVFGEDTREPVSP